MITRLVILGCGGHGRELFDVVRAVDSAGDDDYEVLGFLDDAPRPADLDLVERLGSRVVGTSAWLASAAPDVACVLGIGDPRVRQSLAESAGVVDRAAPVLVHPTASTGSDTHLGPGTVLFAGARLTTNVETGRHVHVNQAALVAHDCRVGDYVSVNPAAAVSGACHLGAAAMVGAGAVVLQGRSVGERARVGAGAVVTRDVVPGATVVGAPAR